MFSFFNQYRLPVLSFRHFPLWHFILQISWIRLVLFPILFRKFIKLASEYFRSKYCFAPYTKQINQICNTNCEQKLIRNCIVRILGRLKGPWQGLPVNSISFSTYFYLLSEHSLLYGIMNSRYSEHLMPP